jgi:hypothetical protein
VVARPCLKNEIKISKSIGSIAQMVKCLPSTCNDLGSIPSTVTELIVAKGEKGSRVKKGGIFVV